MELKELLDIDLNHEIDAVIKVGNHDEQQVTQEINNYIVTDKIAEHLETFIDVYGKNRQQTGVWLSGFYGSGKSYFAKILGYLLENRELSGVKAQELFKPRLKGLEDRYLLENKLESLNYYKTKVVMFDLSGESKHLNFFSKLLLNFLDSIGLTKDYQGYVEFQMMKAGKYAEFKDKVEERYGEKWEKLRYNSLQSPKILTEIYAELEDDTEEKIEKGIANTKEKLKELNADWLVKELDSFLEWDDRYERIAFIIDEMSEAIDKDDIGINELRGAAQHLSQDGDGKYWLVVTAQEKLDAVISKENVSQNDLNIITDRFQTKIHLSSEEVDKVIKERLLKKSDQGETALSDFYRKNEGIINSLTSLEAKFNTKTETVEEFISYYPFHNYQMRLLKNFLFSVFQQAKTGGSERGMLVTIDKILKGKKLFNAKLGEFATADQLSLYGFPLPQSEHTERKKKAKASVEDEGVAIDGEKLIETIFFLEKSEDVKRTLDNIAKSYNDKLAYVGDLKGHLKKALDRLEIDNLLIVKNGEFSITTDTEKNLMEEMKRLDVNREDKLGIVKSYVKEFPFFSQITNVQLDNKTYNVSVKDEHGTVLSAHKGDVSFVIYNIYNVIGDIGEFLEEKKEEYLSKKEAAIIPVTDKFRKIDSLLMECYRYQELIRKYRTSTDDEIKAVVESFDHILVSKQEELERLLKESYENGFLLYDFTETRLDSNKIEAELKKVSQQMIDRTYDRRLKTTLDLELAKKIINEDKSSRLKDYFNHPQVEFFDKNGAFIGENLMVVSEIEQCCSERGGTEGSTLIDIFTASPYGWDYADIAVTLAVIFRSGKLKIVYDGKTYRDYSKDKEAISILEKSNRFKKAKFTVITESLSSLEKEAIVQVLIDVTQENQRVNFNDTDYKIIEAVVNISGDYINQLEQAKRNLGNLSQDIINEERDDLQVVKDFANREIDEVELKGLAREFIDNKDEYKSGINYIRNMRNFAEHRFSKYNKFEGFIKEVESQLDNAYITNGLVDEIKTGIDEYKNLKRGDLLNEFDQLQDQYQTVRQKYYSLMKSEHEELTEKYKDLIKEAEQLKEKIEEVDEEENGEMLGKVKRYIKEGNKFMEGEFALLEESGKCRHCNRSLMEINQAKELSGNRLEEIRKYRIKRPVSVGDNGNDFVPKELSFTLPRETDNLKYLENQLNKILDEIRNENNAKVIIDLKQEEEL